MHKNKQENVTKSVFQIGAAEGEHSAARVPARRTDTRTDECEGEVANLAVAELPPGLAVASAAPRSVIRGESPRTVDDAAVIDWLNFTFPESLYHDFSELNHMFREAFGFSITMPRDRGHLGYKTSWELGENYGIYAYGGKSQATSRLVSIPGTGCAAIKDWKAVHALLMKLGARITRVDLAHDDFEGEHDIYSAVSLYLTGHFITSGRPPSAQFVDDFGSNKGNTFYVGSRKNGKLLRVYEKGKKFGDASSPWVRWEVEFHNTRRQIPLDVLLRPGVYLAGSFPALSWISESQDRIKTITKQARIGYDELLKHCRNGYGKLIWTMREVLELTPDAIFEELAKQGLPTRLNVPMVGGGE